MTYLEWNNLIAKYFFNEEKTNREVLLYVNEHVLETIGSEQNADKNDFIIALKGGPPWATRQGFCQKALQTCTNWRSRQLDYPPYIGYLAFFVLSAGLEADFASHAYYPRFWTLLGEPKDKGTPPSFEDMIQLWDDLEKWSREDKHETLGRFVARIRGGWWKVGLPLSQTVISEEERKHLHGLFEVANLDPTDPPSPEVMAKLFSVHGSNVFEKKTIRLLHSNEGESGILKHALVDLVLDELETWDGVVYADEKEDAGKQVHRRRIQAAGLRICMNHDAVSQEIKCYLRFKTAKSFPEEGLHFERYGDNRIYSCMETFQGWSTSLKYSEKESVNRLDGVSVDWIKGEDFVDKENEWRAKLRGATTRLFRLGTDGLPDWVESQMLERGIEFYIAFSGSDIETIRDWGGKHCERLKELKVSGLPQGWVLFYGKNATQSCAGIDVLSISSQVRMHLKEGIRSGRGNTFFYFAPPKVFVENGMGNETVVVNDRQMVRKNLLEPVWNLPNDVPIGEPLRIEVKLEDRSLSRIIRLETFGVPASCATAPFRNRTGDFCSPDEPSRVCGVIVVDTVSSVSYPQLLPFHLSNRIIFIGRRPGEVVIWPIDSVPQDWQPVWALTCIKRKLWAANFCGTNEDLRIDNVPKDPLTDRKKLKMWREVLWVQRKITVGPQLGQLKKVWNKYVEAASHV